jgi:tetratricopeptide (TPR) repeat protein
MIRSVSRRWFLVGLLGIPASKLGLEGEPPWNEKKHFPVNNDVMASFENELQVRWHLYQISGPTVVSHGLDIWTMRVEEFVRASQSTPWHKRALTVLSMNYQLQGSTLRDAQHYSQAYGSFRDAFRAAHEAENDELKAATLLREGMNYMAQEQPFKAISNFNGALDFIQRRSFPRLRGKLLQARAEAYALAQRPEDCWTSIGLATHILGREEHGEEQSQALFNPSSVVLWKGLYAFLLHDYNRAITFFDKGLEPHGSSLAPDRARFLSRKAEACHKAHRIDEAITAAHEALSIASQIKKKSTIERVSQLHNELHHSQWRNERGVKALGLALQQHQEMNKR